MAEHVNYDDEHPEFIIPSTTSFHWGISAVLAAVFYLGGQQLLQMQKFANWENVLLASGGGLILSLALIAASWCRMYCKTGIFPGIHHSTLYDKTWNGEFKFTAKKGIVQSCVAGVCNFLGFMAMFGSLTLDQNEGSGFIACLVVMVSVTVGVLNYWLHDEQYTLTQVFGILVILFGTQLYNSHWEFSEYQYSITGGAIALMIFTARGVLNKSAAAVKFDAYTGSLLGCLCDALVGLVGYVVLILLNGLRDYEFIDFLLAFGSGICLSLGSFFLTYAVMIGNSGVSYAVTTIQILIMADLKVGSFADIPIGVLVGSFLLCFIGLGIAIGGGAICRAASFRFDYTLNRKKPTIELPLLAESVNIYRDN